MRVLVFLFFIVNFIFANQFYETKILKSNSDLNFKNIKGNQNFKEVSFPLSIKRDSDNYWIELKINKSKFTKGRDLLKISSMFVVCL